MREICVYVIYGYVDTARVLDVLSCMVIVTSEYRSTKLQ